MREAGVPRVNIRDPLTRQRGWGAGSCLPGCAHLTLCPERLSIAFMGYQPQKWEPAARDLLYELWPQALSLMEITRRINAIPGIRKRSADSVRNKAKRDGLKLNKQLDPRGKPKRRGTPSLSLVGTGRVRWYPGRYARSAPAPKCRVLNCDVMNLLPDGCRMVMGHDAHQSPLWCNRKTDKPPWCAEHLIGLYREDPWDYVPPSPAIAVIDEDFDK